MSPGRQPTMERDMPRRGRKPLLERLWWPVLLLAIPGGSLMLLTLLAPLIDGSSRSWLMFLLLVGPIVGLSQAVGFLGDMIIHDRAMAKLRGGQFRVCPRCRYDLGSSPQTGACSECGTRYDPASLKRVWLATYGEHEEIAGAEEPREQSGAEKR